MNARFWVIAGMLLIGLSCGGNGNGGDTTPPSVSSTVPGSAEEDVAEDVYEVSATFSEAMDPATISDATFVLQGPGGDIA